MLDLLYQGGIIMIPIGICSILSLAFTIERAWYLWREHVPVREFWEALEPHLQNRDYDRALENIRSYDGVLADVIRTGLNAQPRSYTRVSEEMEEVGMESVPRLEKFLPTLNFIAQVSPLLGLLGTVAGMIQTFSVIAEAGVGRPNLLAGGISEALITTASGLTVGIITLFFHHMLSRRVDEMIHEVEMGVRRVETSFKEYSDLAPDSGDQAVPVDEGTVEEETVEEEYRETEEVPP